MRVGLIDCDNKNAKNPFPNLALMKISAWHKRRGDVVGWYEPLMSWEPYDKVYVSKVFSFSEDYELAINANEIIFGGSGFAITMKDGKEIYDKAKDISLPDEIEHIYPDYGLYGINDTAYGFITRGCPRGCEFCHVQYMQGRKAEKVAELSEFWNGQKNIVLLDPNISACKEWRNVFQQLIDSKANVDFSQGLDIRLMTDEKINMLSQIKTKSVHFAWDRYEDKEVVLPKLKRLAELTQWDRRRIVVYCIVGVKERMILPEDLERIYSLRQFAYPYITIYDKDSLPRGHELKRLQRWVNNRFIWESCPTFDDYKRVMNYEL